MQAFLQLLANNSLLMTENAKQHFSKLELTKLLFCILVLIFYSELFQHHAGWWSYFISSSCCKLSRTSWRWLICWICSFVFIGFFFTETEQFFCINDQCLFRASFGWILAPKILTPTNFLNRSWWEKGMPIFSSKKSEFPKMPRE